MIESRSYWLGVVRMAVQLAADVEDATLLEHLPDDAGAVLVFPDHPHQQAAMGYAIDWSVVLAVLPPVSIAVPIEETNQLVVNLIEEPPNPVHPEGLEAFDRGPAD